MVQSATRKYDSIIDLWTRQHVCRCHGIESRVDKLWFPSSVREEVRNNVLDDLRRQYGEDISVLGRDIV